MTDEEADALGARLAACKHFRPLPGLRDMQGRTWEQSLLWRWSSTIDRPDIREPATKGIVLALVREAWNDSGFYVARSNTRIKDTDILGWDFFGNLRGKSCKGMLYRSEAEALVAALENAPA